jgi:hypothetical protein
MKGTKVIGKYVKKEFIAEMEKIGISLIPFTEHIKESKYKTTDGRIVGIAYSTENIENHKYFLGLRKDKYNIIVLLC